MTFSKATFKGTAIVSLLLTATSAFATPAPAAVPEPSSVAPLAIGAIAIIGMVAWNRMKQLKSASDR